jgi:acyl-coenzyme A synthetase/AMP-(fatty) acid ligase
VSRARSLTLTTSHALRKHFGIGENGAGKDICSVISTGHYLLPVLAYGIIGAGGVFSAASAASTAGELGKQIVGAGSRALVTCEATREVAVRAAEEAGWGVNGGGRVVVMSEGAEWALRVVGEDGGLGVNLVEEGAELEWERVTDARVLEESLVVLIYSSGTTGLPKGKYTCTCRIQTNTTQASNYPTATSSPKPSSQATCSNPGSPRRDPTLNTAPLRTSPWRT